MKKVIFAALMLASVSSFAHTNASASSYAVMKSGDGQHIPASEVPRAVKVSFRNMFPTATNVRWEREREHGSVIYKASFNFNGSKMTAKFAPDGTYLGN